MLLRDNINSICTLRNLFLLVSYSTVVIQKPTTWLAMLLYLEKAGLPPGCTHWPEEGKKRRLSNSCKTAVFYIKKKD